VLCVCAQISFKHLTPLFSLSNYYFDRANFFLKLPSQTLFSNLVAIKPQTSFTHCLILKLGFQISASKFIFKLFFQDFIIKFCSYICSQSLYMLVWKHGASAPSMVKWLLGELFLFAHCHWVFLTNDGSPSKQHHQSSWLYRHSHAGLVPLLLCKHALQIISQTEFAATTCTFFFSFF